MPTNTTQRPELNSQFDPAAYDIFLHRRNVAQVLIDNTCRVLDSSLGSDVRPAQEEVALDAQMPVIDTTPSDGLDLGAVPGPQWHDFTAYPSFSSDPGNQTDYELAA